MNHGRNFHLFYLCCRCLLPLWVCCPGCQTEAAAVGRGSFSVVSSDSSGGENLLEWVQDSKDGICLDAAHVFVLVVAEGLSGPHGSPDGWPNPVCGAAWARRECPVPGHPADGAGAGWGEGTTQPHTGCYCCNSRPTGCFYIYSISFWIGLFFTEDFSQWDHHQKCKAYFPDLSPGEAESR